MNRPVLARVLGRADLLFFSVSAVLTIDALASAASLGTAWFFWWAVVLALFFVPCALITAELGAAWPAEGGLFVWVREGLGPRAGALAAWLYWINNAFWIPTVGLVCAGVARSLWLDRWLPHGWKSGAGSVWFDTALAIAMIWVAVGAGLVRLSVAKWIPTAGALIKIAIFLALGGAACAAWRAGTPAANDFSPAALLPRAGDSLVFLPILIYNVLGFELMSAAGGEMKDPPRDVPRTIAIGGLLIGVLYALGVGGILRAVPLEKLSLTTGTWDALVILGADWGRGGRWLIALLGAGFLSACLANVVTWSLGVNRVIAAAANAGAAAPFLGRLDPRHGAPRGAFLATGGLATALLLGNALLAASPVNLFWMTFKLSSLCYLLCHLLLCPAFLALRRGRADQARPYRLPGGPFAARLAAGLVFLGALAASALFFLPAPGAPHALRDTLLLAGETAVTLAAGWWLAPRGHGG